ncbi:hypothetical protein HDU97_004173 [Phlyctochytrium planicorne]|nr:hypothetical protein HDU97_004173 [Phlyctochytrium planicorne]
MATSNLAPSKLPNERESTSSFQMSGGNSTPARSESSAPSVTNSTTLVPEKVIFDGSIRKFLENHVLFQNLDEEFIMSINNSMQSRVYSQNEYVIRKGEVGRAMFFILRGEVEVVSEDGETILNVMKEQSFFGEIGVLFSVPRTASCRARGRCIILNLTKEKLEKLLEGYPQVSEAIAMIAQERFSLHMKQEKSSMKVEFGKEIQLGITNKDLKSVPLFRDCEVGFLHMLALTLSPVQFRCGDIIIHKGDVAGEMYFVADGEAEVFSDEDGRVFAHFHPGTFFGEVGLFFKIKRTASVRCISSTITVFKLEKKDLDTVLGAYPEIDAKIKVEAKQRFEYNKMREMAKLTGKQEVETDIEVVREKLKSIPLFKGGSIGFFHELALSLKFKVFQPGDLIIQKDQPGRSMYFVVDGTAEVISSDGLEVFGTLLQNTFFGEVALFFDVNRTASVRARTVCTLFELDKDSLKKVLQQHKTLRDQMQEKAEENLRLWQARQNALMQLSSRNQNTDIQKYSIEATVTRLRQIPLFERCHENFLRGLAHHTSVHEFIKDEVLIKAGDASSDMFIVVKGKVEIISEDFSQIYDMVEENGFFGEVGLLMGVTRTASVRCATENCKVIMLSSQALNNVLEEYPESYQIIELEAGKRYQLAQTRKLEKEHAKLVFENNARKKSACESDSQTGMAAAATAAALARHRDLDHKNGRSKSPHSVSPKPAPLTLHLSIFQRKRSLSVNSADGHHRASLGNIFKRRPSTTVPHEDDLKEESTGDISSSSSSAAPSSEKKSGKISKMMQSLKNTFSRGSEKSSRVGVAPPPKGGKSPAQSITGLGSQLQKSASQQSNMSHIKHDHIFDILDSDLASTLAYLNPKERFGLRLVCKRWANLLAEPKFWSSLDMKPLFTRLNPELFLNFISLSADFLTVINLDSCWQVLDDELNALGSYCPNVSTLSVRNCWKITDRGVSYLATSLTKIKEVDLSYCGQLNGSAFVEHRWTSLNKLNVTYCKQIGDAQLEKILCKSTDITEIRLRRCSRITDFGVFLIVRYCR